MIVQVGLGVTSLKYLANQMGLDVKDKPNRKRLVIKTNLVITCILIAVFLLRRFIYNLGITDDLIHASIFINLSWLAYFYMVKIKKFQKVVLWVRRLLIIYGVLGYGFYYIYYLFKLLFSGKLI